MATIVGPAGFNVAPNEAAALSVPAVSRAVQLYTTAASKLPSTDAPAFEWFSRGSGALTPEDRIAAMVLSLIFHGKAVLWVIRDGSGAITDALVLPAETFGLDIFGRVTMKGTVLPNQDQFLYVKSLLPQGFLTFGADAVRHYLGLRDSILSRSRNPIPVVELKVKDQFEVTTDELNTAQANWSKARSAENGAVAITPYGIDVIVHGTAADTAMLSEARNAVRLDVANFLNINASLLDGNNGTSDTYSNTLQNKDEFTDLSLDTFLTPIEARFSMPDVSPDGTPFRFDRSVLDVSPPAVGNTGSAIEARPDPAVPPATTTTEGTTTA
jgi:phage portal protein BeeE